MRRILLAIALLPLLWAFPAKAVDCQYRVTSPTLPDQQFIILQCDNSGALRVAPTANAYALANASVPIYITTATTTELIAASVSKQIVVTGFNFIASAADTFKFVYGSGAACGTGTADLTGAYSLASQSGVAFGNGYGVVFSIPAGKALCAVTTTTAAVAGSVSYTQF